MPILLNGLTVVSLSIWHPWQGAWIASADFELAPVPVSPAGKVALTVGTTVMAGTVDPNRAGIFGVKGQARVVAGGGGWGKRLAARQYHNDAGVLNSAVITTTAIEAGEAAVVVVPTPLGADYDRAAGPASNVLAGLDWYVTPQGVTTIGPRARTPAVPGSIDILSWDPENRIAELASDDLIVPGTILTDVRLGTTMIGDVHQTFSPDGGARAKAWCLDVGVATPSTGGSRTAGALRALIEQAAVRAPYLKPYHYRVVTVGIDGRLSLQAVNRSAGVPDSILIDVWYGVPGVTATITPGSEVVVSFLDGNPAKPVVTGFKRDTIPDPSPIARATAVTALVTALDAFSDALSPLVGTVGAAGPACAALKSALSALAPDVPSRTLQVDR